MDVSIKAVTQGFDEAKAKIAGLADALDKTTKASEEASSAAGGSSGGFSASLESLHGVAIAATAAVGVGLAFAATTAASKLKEAITETMSLGDHLNNLSQITGLSVERLGGLKLAADVSGTSIDGLSQGIVRFNQHFDDAQKGTGIAAEAFKRLGIEIKNMSSEEAFNVFVDKMAGMRDGSEKVAIGGELMGLTFRNLIPLINQGSEGLAKLEGEAKKAGIVMSAETAKAAQELNENLAVLGAYGKGFWAEVAAPIVEALAKVTAAMREARDSGSGLVGSLWSGVTNAARLAMFGSEQSQIEASRKKIVDIQSGKLNYGIDNAVILAEEEHKIAALTAYLNPTGSPAPKTTPPPRVTKPGKVTPETSLESLYSSAKQQEEMTANVFGKSMVDMDDFYDTWATRAQNNGTLHLKILNDWKNYTDKTIGGEIKEEEKASKVRIVLAEQQYKAQQALAKEDAETEKGIQDLMAKYAQEDIDKVRRQIFISKDERIAALEAVAAKEEYVGEAGVKAHELIQKAIRKVRTDEEDFSEKLAQMFAFNVPNAILKTVGAIEGSLQSSIYNFISGTKSLGDSIKDFFTGIKNAILQMFAELAAKKLLQWALGGTDLGNLLSIGATVAGGGSGGSGSSSLGGASTAVSGASLLSRAYTFISGGETAAATIPGTSVAMGSEAATFGTPLVGSEAATFGASSGTATATGAAVAAVFAAYVAGNVLFGEGGIFGHHDLTDYRTPAQKEQSLAVVNKAIALLESNPMKYTVGGAYQASAIKDQLMIDWNSGAYYTDDSQEGLDLMLERARNVSASGYASGTDMVVTRPTAFMAGESGAERVTVSPLSGATHNSGSGRTIIFNGPAMFDEYTFRRFRRMLLDNG